MRKKNMQTTFRQHSHPGLDLAVFWGFVKEEHRKSGGHGRYQIRFQEYLFIDLIVEDDRNF